MTDLKLDANNDLFYEAGQLGNVDELEQLEQSLLIAYSTGRGEWPWDTDAGVAYRSTIRGTGSDEAARIAEFRRVGESVDGVIEVTEVVLTTNPVTRTLTAQVSARTIYGVTTVEV